MNTPTNFCALLGLAVLLESTLNLASAQEATFLRDPRLRDEDISATSLLVTTRRLENGFYEYVYDVVSPSSNLGTLSVYGVDVGCELDFGNVGFPEPPYKYVRRDASDGKHVPVQAYGGIRSDTGRQGGGAGISLSNQVIWTVNLRPGNSIQGLRILSPAPPGPRAYRFTVDMNVDDLEPDGSGWNYPAFQDDDTVPWIPDFEVRGITTGPACALPPPNEPPPPPSGGTFAGSAERSESDAVNRLLSYTAPLRDRFHVEPGVTMVTMTIHYSAEIDPKTFRVEPGWARPLFNPSAGATETVVLPLRDKKSLFQLEAKSVKDKVPRKRDELDQSYTDRDVFEVRQTPVLKAPPGKSR